MVTKDNLSPAESQDQAINEGVAAALSAEALHNLAGWFDVLIQMDFAIKLRNEERGDEDENNFQNPTKEPA